MPDLPLEESDGVRAACDAAGVALVPLVAPTTPDERMARIGASARGFVYAVSVAGTTGERAALAEAFADIVARAKAADRGARSRSGSASGRPSRRARPPTPGADGVIVGSRLVRAVAEAQDAPAAVHDLVAQLRAGPRVEFPPHMGLVVVTTAGLVVWIVMWALGVKAHRLRS